MQFVYAELKDGISASMLEDLLAAIISDTGVFIVTTKENSLKYDEEFYAISWEAIETYRIMYDDGS